MEDNFVPLFAFASNLEFFGVFPECKSFVRNNIRLGEIVELPEGRGFAVVLGVGLLEFATNLSVLLSRFATEGPFTHVVLAGICGAYPGRGVNVGDVVRVDSEIVGDLGVVECDGSFTPWRKVGATSVYESSSLRGVPAWLSNLKPVAGLSVNCCTGTASMAKERSENFNVDIESMEGAACFSICHAFGIPCYEIRAVSNFATTRDKSTWHISDALAALRTALSSNHFLLHMQLSLGISTCPNDTFIYEALLQGLENSPFEWKVTFADVQTLNEMVLRGELDVAKISAQVYPQIAETYRCLGCGGAIGYGCGPLLLSSESGSFNPDLPTTLPGANTTAALLFKFWYAHQFKNAPKLEYALFNEVYQGLLHKSIPQGVTIHEHRFTWKRDGLHLLQDLGAYWEQETGSPIPLGIAVAKKDLGFAEIESIEKEIRASLRIARQRQNPVTPFIVEKAQIDDDEVIKSHIAMFVNDFSENVGEAGWRALENLWRLSHC